MTTRFAWRNLANEIEEIEGRVRVRKLKAVHAVEEGSSPIWQVEIEDPDGDFDITGHRPFVVWDDEAEDPDDQYLAIGYTARRTWKRGPAELTGAARVIVVDVADLNTVLGRRIMTGSDCKRPAETDVERMQWAILTNEAGLIDDSTYLSTASPVNMDACDYRGQYLSNVISDCAEASGKNYGLWWKGPSAGASEPWGEFSILYDFAESTSYSSAIFLTNDIVDIDDSTVFDAAAELLRSPDRVFSGGYLAYDGGYVYDEDTDTADAFARRDTMLPSINVKSKAKALARLTRYLADLNSEDDRLTITYYSTSAKINAIKAGMRVPVKFTHCDGYETWRWVRVLVKTMEDVAGSTYKVTLEASGDPLVVADPPVAPPDPPEESFVVGTLQTQIYSGMNGNNSLAEYGDDGTGPGTLYLYTDCSYRFDFVVSHAHSAPAIWSNYIKVQCDPSQTPVFNMGAVRLGTDNSTVSYVSTPAVGAIHELQRTWVVIAHTAYVNCNGIGSNVVCTVSYVSGPDERFV